MQRFKKILILIPTRIEQDETFDRAVELARFNQAAMTVVTVMQETPVYGEPAAEELSSAEPERQLADRLEQLIAPTRDSGLQIDAKVLTGVPFIEVIRQVLKHDYDLVMKTAAGATRQRSALFGSTALHLMRKCPCPVWIAKPTNHKRYRRIMAAVDPAVWDATKAGLNTLIMDLATSLAQREGGELHIVQAWNPYLERFGSASRLAADAAAEPEAHRQSLAKLLTRYRNRGSDPRVHLVKGNPEDVILDAAAKQQIDLIVMGTVGRVGLPGFFIGNTAEEVLQEVDSSVLTVKPYGFETPVSV